VVVARLIAFVIPLGLDTFAVSAAVGLTGLSRGERLRISLVFAAFEGLTPAVGLLIGGVLGQDIGAVATYLAGGFLIAYALYVLLRNPDAEDEAAGEIATTHGWALILLGLSVSIDGLAVGFTLGLSRVPVVPALILIAAQAFLLSQLGLRLGARLSSRFRKGAERAAGLVLGLLGSWLVLDAVLP
jgi:putative Mn2+ efflux pump MntP